ncbi:MAG TPA: LptF/LptG family permease [Treponemataceae bacterium]|nr:LptF/LptG family permease [Treponemataceae bacterium]
MKILQRYLIRQFIPVMFFSIMFFVLLLELGDLFANIWRYLSNGVGITQILKIVVAYVPKCVSYSIPLSVLFAASYTIGTMHSRNELIMVFSSGYPLYLLVMPLLVLGLFLSFGMFFFEDLVVIRTQAMKSRLSKEMLTKDQSRSNANIVILSESGKVIYTADYFQDGDDKLYSALIIVRDGEGNLRHIVKSPVLAWTDGHWTPETLSVYSVEADGSIRLSSDKLPCALNEPPESFKRNVTSVEEIGSREAKAYLAKLRKSGIPHAEQLSNYYKRFSFPFTVFVVLFFSISVGGRFKKNILLMSLLLSLSIAVMYYVTQMVTMLFAKWEYISPLAGAWMPALIFICLGAFAIKYART